MKKTTMKYCNESVKMAENVNERETAYENGPRGWQSAAARYEIATK